MIKKIAQTLAALGITANAVTFTGFVMNVAAGAMAAQGSWLLAGCWALGGGVCDLIDGTLARLHPDRTKFGALWDSALDRYGDAALIGGIGFYYAGIGDMWILLAALSAIAGSFQISYVRARAEGLGFVCKVGFWERGERWVLLLVGLGLSNPAAAVLILAFATHGTAAHRLVHIRQLSSRSIVPKPSEEGRPKWSRPLNWVCAAAAIACLFLARWPYSTQN